MVKLQSKTFEGDVSFEISKPSQVREHHWGDYARGAKYALKKRFELTKGIEGVIQGSLPVGGLSSSAAVLIAYVMAFAKANDITLQPFEVVKIADLAQRMINLSGAKNVKIEYTGLREGEKLYEEVLNELEGTKPTFHAKIRIAEVRQQDYAQVSKDIEELIEISKRYDNMATVRKMKDIVPEYKSNNSVYEELDK